ncbi:sensor histidine kinase [Pedobacter gandavensis]|uniref:histidine kinase n=1 Tax=Pedobacter gandavensis TaxID=2679963 RepID=A0ABR6F113_9SPHI|nr:HAMP domain-containing sensor histidine kinase [Pedobacter gandavensis]MBB2150912.1 sensor histidine kinase [Pedobacter gandavensis]
MKLQLKLALYNTLTKVAIITFMGILILVSINRISVNHMRQRLIQKKNKLVTNLSSAAINDLLTQQKIFTDYNLLKEEYIILKEVKNNHKEKLKQHFSQETREIEGSQEEYQILSAEFKYHGKRYLLELGQTMSTVGQLEHTISVFTFFILLAAVVLTLLTDLAFSKFLLAPFYQIIDQKLNKVNDPISFNYEPIKTTTDDFRILDQSISTLMNKIADLFLTEKEFIANVSHELLTPISILNTRLENLLNDEKLSVEGENKIFACLKTLNRLKSIINSLLLISKVENNQYKKPDNIVLKEMIQEVYEELEHRLVMMNLTFTINLSASYVFKGNKSLFHTLLMNIVNNAIKYNRPAGSVSIYDTFIDANYTLIIEDTGQGMEVSQVSHAFQRFEKFQSEKEDSYGLGLSIVKSIAAFHELDLEIESEIGQGTRVSIIFPKK